MNEKTKEKLKYFFNQSTWSSLHPMDIERFYKFTAEAYRNGDTRISPDEFLVIGREVRQINNEELVYEYHSRYERAMDVIKVYETGSI